MITKRWIAIGCVVGFWGTAWKARAVAPPPVAEDAAEKLDPATVQIQLQDGFHRPLPGETSLQLPATSTPIDPALRQAVLNAYVVQQGDVLAMLNVPQKPGEYMALLGCYLHREEVPYFTMQLFWAHGRYDKKRWIHLQSREISGWNRQDIWNAERAKHDAAQGEGHSTESPPLPLRSLQAVVDVRAGFFGP